MCNMSHFSVDRKLKAGIIKSFASRVIKVMIGESRDLCVSLCI
jgi:hypothetical protein